MRERKINPRHNVNGIESGTKEEKIEKPEIIGAISGSKKEVNNLSGKIVNEKMTKLTQKIETETIPESEKRVIKIKEAILNNPEIKEIRPKIEPILKRPYKNGRKMRKALAAVFYSHYGDKNSFMRKTLGEKKRKTFKETMETVSEDRKDTLKDQNGLNQIAPSKQEIRSNKKNAEYLKKDQLKKLREEACIWSDITKTMGAAAINKAGAEEFKNRAKWINGAIEAIENNEIDQYPAYQSSNAKKRADMQIMFLSTAGRNPFYPPAHYKKQRNNIQNYQRKAGGLLKNVKSLNNHQKQRIGSLASIAGGIATAWAIGNVLGRRGGKDKKLGRAVLGTTASLSALSYVADGSIMGIGGLLKGGLVGGSNGCKIKKMLKMFGVENGIAGFLGEETAEGTEKMTLQQGAVMNILPQDKTYRESMDEFFDSDGSTITYKKDSNGNILLANYRAQQKQQNKVDQIRAMAATQGQLDSGLTMIGIKKNLLDKSDEKINIFKIKALRKKLYDHCTENKLKVKEGNDNLLSKYFSGEYSRNKLMNHEDLFEAKEQATITTQARAYEAQDPLDIIKYTDIYPDLKDIVISDIVANSTYNGVWYDIDWQKISKEKNKPALLKSTEQDKANRTIAVNHIAQATAADKQTREKDSKTLQAYITENTGGLKRLSEAYTELNRQETRISPNKWTEIQKSILKAKDTQEVKKIIQKGVTDGDITFDLSVSPLLDNVNNNQVQTRLKDTLRKDSTISTIKKTKILAREQHLKSSLKGKLPTNINISPDGKTKNIHLTSYYKTTTINTKPNQQGIYTITTKDGKKYNYAKTLQEAIYMANFLNTAPWMMSGEANNSAPFKSESGKIDFKHNNSWLEGAADIWTSGFDLQTIKKTIDTTYLSTEGIATYMPSLNIEKNRKSFCSQLNSMDVWDKEKDTTKLRKNIEQTLNEIDTLNLKRSHKVALYDKNGTEITKNNLAKVEFKDISNTGNLVQLKVKKPTGENGAITIDLQDNQVFGNTSPLMFPNQQLAIKAADKLLTIENLTRDISKDIGDLLIKDIPERLREDLGIKNVAKTGEKAIKYLTPFFTELGDIIDGCYNISVKTLNVIAHPIVNIEQLGAYLKSLI